MCFLVWPWVFSKPKINIFSNFMTWIWNCWKIYCKLLTVRSIHSALGNRKLRKILELEKLFLIFFKLTRRLPKILCEKQKRCERNRFERLPERSSARLINVRPLRDWTIEIATTKSEWCAYFSIKIHRESIYCVRMWLVHVLRAFLTPMLQATAHAKYP